MLRNAFNVAASNASVRQRLHAASAQRTFVCFVVKSSGSQTYTGNNTDSGIHHINVSNGYQQQPKDQNQQEVDKLIHDMLKLSETFETADEMVLQDKEFLATRF